jgi:hypothetical protein
MPFQRFLAPRGAGAQHVYAHPGEHRCQPATQVGHIARVGAAEPNPGLLDRVVGFVGRAEHPVGDGPQMDAVSLELLG